MPAVVLGLILLKYISDTFRSVQSRLGETILDPACGTGGFLVCATEHLRKQAKTEADERTLKNPHSSETGPGDADHLLPEYEKLLAEIAETRAALKRELHQALCQTT